MKPNETGIDQLLLNIEEKTILKYCEEIKEFSFQDNS